MLGWQNRGWRANCGSMTEIFGDLNWHSEDTTRPLVVLNAACMFVKTFVFSTVNSSALVMSLHVEMNLSNDFLWTVSFSVGKSETCNSCSNPSFCVINDALSTTVMYVLLSDLFWVVLTFFLANSCVNLGYENNWLDLRRLSILSADLWSSPHGAEVVFLNFAFSGPGTDVNPVLSPEPVDFDPPSLLVSNSSDVFFSSFRSRFIISSRDTVVSSVEYSSVSSHLTLGRDLRCHPPCVAEYHRWTH